MLQRVFDEFGMRREHFLVLLARILLKRKRSEVSKVGWDQRRRGVIGLEMRFRLLEVSSNTAFLKTTKSGRELFALPRIGRRRFVSVTMTIKKPLWTLIHEKFLPDCIDKIANRPSYVFSTFCTILGAISMLPAEGSRFAVDLDLLAPPLMSS